MKSKQERSSLFKTFQSQIKCKDKFEEGKINLLQLRKELKEIDDYIFANCEKKDYCIMPLKSDKTIAYYLYHLTRIEDITSNTLILGKKQVFFENKYDSLLSSPIKTTGNELKRDQLVQFSLSLDINQLKHYVDDVYANTNQLINQMNFKESRLKVKDVRKNDLIKLNVVSTDENAFWLVDYWCKKTYAGLFLMPFSRHQMLHLDGCLRIMHKIKK
ncbi:MULTISPECIES: phage head-tail adapter protein [unclassified Sedimentibacter]|uniref:phage head-tail adapter protein n=1 Tax=unclassified Sedimentibacter TaxID=2649220 RepID=UPI0027E023DC|nr:phage head-tail adapter protein [Sedimentibacter sp. MB35-C1]WMJ76845.1 phage head-tail adapter protein [Sedimentibacter sp. MB35-C1]